MVINKSKFLRNFTNALLCGSAAWSIGRINWFTNPVLFSSYVHLILFGLTDTMSHVPGSWKDTISEKFKMISDTAPLPMLNIQLLINNSFKKDEILVHMTGLAFPLLAEVFGEENSCDGRLLSQLASICSLAFISNKTNNFYGTIAAIGKFIDEIIIQFFLFDDNGHPSETGYLCSTIAKSIFCVLSALSVTKS